LWAVCGSFAVIAAAASIYGEMVLAPQSRISTSRQPLLFNQEMLNLNLVQLESADTALVVVDSDAPSKAGHP
jgi:hypothetical protein